MWKVCWWDPYGYPKFEYHDNLGSAMDQYYYICSYDSSVEIPLPVTVFDLIQESGHD